MFMKKGHLIISILYLAIFSCKQTSQSKTAKKEQPPNIIFIFADDWGYGDLGIHGSDFAETPHLDQMAKEGIDFQNFTVNNPVCSPSRTAVMTGQYPARHSVHGHFASVESQIKRQMPDWLDPQAPMLPRMLKKAGYATAHFGKWHLSNTHIEDAPNPTAYGYDSYAAFNLPSRLHQMHPDSTFYKTIDFIKKHKEGPFFVNAWIHATHTPHYPKQKYLEMFSHLDEQKQVYAAIVAEADDRIGLLFKTLKDLGIDKNTLVVFSSDNGPEFTGDKKKLDDNSTGRGYGSYYSLGETAGLRGQKRSLFAGGVRIPFIVRWPGTIPVGQINTTASLTAVDLLPTFVELSKSKLPKDYQPDGESIVPALLGKPFEREKAVYWQWKYARSRANFWPSAAIEDGRWKFLMNHKTGQKALFDISQDWAEQKDISKSHPEIVAQLEQKIKTWENSLPTKAPTHCFSKARSQLKNE